MRFIFNDADSDYKQLLKKAGITNLGNRRLQDACMIGMNIITQLQEPCKNGSQMFLLSEQPDALVEPLRVQTPGNLTFINMVSHVVNGQLHVRVVNITDEEVWLQSHKRIGVLHEINDFMDAKNTVDFESFNK